MQVLQNSLCRLPDLRTHLRALGERMALNALVDGELEAHEASTWAARIAADPELNRVSMA